MTECGDSAYFIKVRILRAIWHPLPILVIALQFLVENYFSSIPYSLVRLLLKMSCLPLAKGWDGGPRPWNLHFEQNEKKTKNTWHPWLTDTTL